MSASIDLFAASPPVSVATARELIIDSFAGGGGASTGIEMALGRSPDYAINHDAEALALHAANHPETVHLSENIWKVDPLDVVHGQPVGLAWFSPDCKHFSKAKGGAPVKKNIRDLAWVIVNWAKRAKPRVIFVENVEEFQGWGPLDEHNQPCKDRKGETFKQWVKALKRLGYKVEWRELRACDYGAPTIRKRLFIVARCDKRPIIWPAPTHGKPTDPEVIAGRKKPWRTAAEIIDWSLPCHSIFLTREEGRAAGVNRPLAEATMARIAKGVKRYVLDAAKPFIVTVNHQGEGFRGQDLKDPFCTVTSARDGHGLVVPHIEAAQHGGSIRDAAEPLHTVTASRKDQNVVVGASLCGVGGRAGQSRPRSADEPGATITAKADTVLVAPHVMTMRNAQKPHNGADEPAHTVTAGGAGLSLVAAHVTKFNTGSVGSEASEPLPTVTSSHSDYHPGAATPLGIVAATMVQTGYGEREGQEPRALDIGKPLGTVVAGGQKHAAVAAFLAQHSAGSHPGQPAKDVEAPISTITGSGSQQSVVSAGMINMKGSDQRTVDVETPVSAICAQGNHVAEVRAFLTTYYGTDQDPRLEEPLSTVTTKDRFGIVTIEGQDYIIADIGMRMLNPRELYRAQGFPADYKIEIEFNGKRLPKSSQTRMCGNSVCPPMASALVAANCPDLIEMREAAE